MDENEWWKTVQRDVERAAKRIVPVLKSRQADIRRVAQRLLPVLKFGTAIVDKIPTSEDTWPQAAAKVLALCDAAAKSANEGRAPLHELVGRYEMTAHQGETFVQLFFNTALQDQFKLTRHTLTDNEAAIEATDVEGNKLFFHEYRGMGGVILESDFYTSTGLDMERVIDVLWGGYPGGIYLTVVQNPGEWRTKTSIHAIPPVGGAKMSTAAQSRLTDLAARHRQFLKDRVHRCYLFFGPPGTGKTTAACVLSAEFGGRILKLDAVSLPRMTVGEMGFLLETLKPSFLLVDDVDLAPLDGVGPRVLYLMEHLKAHFPETAIILTANDPSKLPPAWLRCGRIDIPVEFEAPTGPERTQMVASLLTRYGADPSMTEGVVAEIEKDDLPHADLDDMCRRLKHESLDEVLVSLRLLKKLSALASTPPAVPGPSNGPSPAPSPS